MKKYKKIIGREFNLYRGNFKLSYSTINSVIEKFKSISSNPKWVIDLMLYVVEEGIEFTNTYGDIDKEFYQNIYEWYASTIYYIAEHNQEDYYREKCDELMEDSQGIGWGFGDNMLSIYCEYFIEID
ncbi:MAG: hypothetical protein KAX49_20415 [Halanaerobiales bacterium]|nr:hypothetical protein [Halanaerobiales bacterium]